MKIYQGTRGRNGIAAVTVQDVTAPSPLDCRRDLRNHSLDGLEWGYAGSGPTQLAFVLLTEHFGSGPGGLWLATALQQDFKLEVIAGLPRDSWTLTSEQIGQALRHITKDKDARFWSQVLDAVELEFFGSSQVADHYAGEGQA